MTPAQILIYEHGPIIQCLNCINKAKDKMQNGKDVSKDFWVKSIEFLRGFADKCHHAKEEKYFLPLVEEKGTRKYKAYVKVVFAEHELGRAYIAEAEEAINYFYDGNKDYSRSIYSNFTDYIEMLINHINKENIYFINCEKEFLQNNIKELEEKFEKVEKEEIGEGVHEHYLALLEEIKSFL